MSSNNESRLTSPISIDSQPTQSTEPTASQNISRQVNKYINSKYNRPEYKLSERIYIFKNNLFTREILPINYNKELEIFI